KLILDKLALLSDQVQTVIVRVDKLENKVDEGFKKQAEFNNYIKNEVEELRTEVQELKVAQKKTDEKLDRVIKLNNLKS
ncbi:MAG: hypothetical protein LBC44_04135, partial [Mycoplasmataceae bacterium]|nr:hypothetical protein [Mycoplasmataceae bacterium]